MSNNGDLFNEIRKNEMSMEITKEQLIRILDTLDIGVIYTDIDGNMQFINDMAEDVRNISKEDKIGQNVIDCHAVKGKPHVKKLLDVFKEGSVGHRHRLVRIRDKYFDNKYLVVQNPESEPSGIVLMSQDVTEKIELKKKLDDHYRTLNDQIEKKSHEIEERYKELMKMQQRLMHSEKMSSVGQFVSIVAHEVNNPLDGIKNCLQAINDEPGNLEQTKKYSSLALEAVVKIEEVTRLILNYARPDNYNMEETGIADVVEESIRFTKYKLDRNGIKIVTDYDSGLTVNCSKQHLVQVFVNMIINGIDAINEKRAHVQNGVENEDFVRITIEDAGEDACVTITDSGCGVHTDNVKQLFQPFYTSKKEKGTGLGLYICFNIVYIHNGRISVKSPEGEGASFMITLPKFSYSNVEKSMEKVSKLRERVLQGYVEQ